ncbi:MAG TPA: hypothetical protein VI685_01255 [Candidatus Angelobacter sp.]
MNFRRSLLRATLVCLVTGGIGFGFIVSTRGAGAQNPQVDPDLTAHEWGTFTSVAGSDGHAVEWLPLTGSWPSQSTAATVNDLPAFIEHFGYLGFKVGLRGTVRMETPVIYFYSPRNVDVSVHVSLSKGLITEWYPHGAIFPDGNPPSPALAKNNGDGAITWDIVHVEPGLAPNFSRENSDSHYYAARETSASPLRVEAAKGDQREKFLFYRGVSAFSVPVSARVTAEGNVLVSNLGKEEIPSLVLFERRGEKMGYRISGELQTQGQMEPPELNASVESLYGDLEEMLVARGLFWDEAHAMVQTWRSSWFEEGSRLFYIVPASFVDSVLPLTINPAPAKTVRVFVGRMELVTPATQRAVETAMAAHDDATLHKYSRFLEPILAIIKERSPAKKNQLTNLTGSTCNGQVAQK